MFQTCDGLAMCPGSILTFTQLSLTPTPGGYLSEGQKVQLMDGFFSLCYPLILFLFL